MKLYTLMEDTACAPEFVCEHGLSFYIEINGRKLLFDMGQTDLYLQHAKTLGVNLSEVDTAFISHGHYDHGGGLAAFLAVNDHAPVYLHRTAFEPYFSEKPEGIKMIGLDASLAAQPRIRLTDGVTQIAPDMTLFSGISGTDCRPYANRVLFERENGAYIPDRFTHEQGLLLREGELLVLLTGCAHSGVVNMFIRAVEVAGRAPDVIIGGTHLGGSVVTGEEPEENIRAVAARLAETGCRCYTCHCTGQRAFALLRETLGERISFLAAGSVLEL